MIVIYSVKETVDTISFMLQYETCRAFGISYLSFSEAFTMCHKLDMRHMSQAQLQCNQEYLGGFKY